MITQNDLSMALDAIDPAACSYEAWMRIGMALKYEGFHVGAWEAWSRRDSTRYHEGECRHKWEGFHGNTTPVTGRSIFRIAREQGTWPPESWDSDFELTYGFDDHHDTWSDEDFERFCELHISTLSAEWDLTDADLAEWEAEVEAFDSAMAAKYSRLEPGATSVHDAPRGSLPPLVSFADVKDDLPELAPELVAGILRQGHKMTLAGPSKAGKSFALISLAIAIAEGREWLGWRCAQGPVVYVNLEVDPSSFLHRVADTYAALGWSQDHTDNLYAWNLRGYSCDIAALSEDLIATVDSVRPRAIILDPAYKLNDGDENAARDMARFTRSLDEIATRSAASIIICHHHSKGAQGGKASRDRASGSGVIARDADALIDLIEVDKPGARERLFERLSLERMCAVMDSHASGWRETYGTPSGRADALRSLCRELLATDVMNSLIRELDALEARTWHAKPLEVSPTLREFADGYTRRVWYMCPVHIPAGDELEDARPEGMARDKKSASDYNAETITAFEAISVDGVTTVAEIAEYLSVKERQARDRIDRAGLIREHGGKVSR